MAKKPQDLKPDDDGFLRTGIYQRFVNEPPELSVDEKEAALDSMVDAQNQPASERLQEIRCSLREIVWPFLEGPYEPSEATAMRDARFCAIDLGDGVKTYKVLPTLYGRNWKVERALNALDALEQIRVVEHNLDGGKQDFLFRSALRLGMLCERIQIRAFEPLVVSGKKAIARASKGGKASRRLTAEQEKLALEIIKEKQTGGVSKSAACVRAAADLKKRHNIDVSKATLLRLLRG